WDMVLSPDGRWLAIAMSDERDALNDRQSYRVQLWETISGLPGPCLRVDKLAMSLSFAPDGRILAAGCRDGVIRLLEASTLRECCHFKGHRSYVCALAFSADSSRLVSGSADTTALVWEVPSLPRPAPARSSSLKPEALWDALGGKDP